MIRRLDKTLGDYLGIAVSPVLIMTLIGSLVFFLLEVVYTGSYAGRLHFIFALFVMATVLIGRIAIEEGKERAYAFAAPLAVVTFLAIGRFADLGWLGSVLLIGIIWWCAHKLTWDCTLIDETEDASGEGLMQTVGLDEKAAQTAPPEAEAETGPEDEPEPAEEPEGVTSPVDQVRSWWDRFVERRRRPHAPGVWVVYFSLAALPLFGIGQLFIRKENTAGRRYAFMLLVVYVASGLGLLLLTSFLGLRRYLRQRRIQMPPAMAGAWLAIGCALLVGLLAFTMFLPRPGAEIEAARLPFTVGSDRQRSSRHAMMKSDPAEEDAGGPRVGTREEDEDLPSGAAGEGDKQGSSGGAQSEQGEGGSGSEGEQGGASGGEQGDQGGSSGESKGGGSDSESGSEGEKGASGEEGEEGEEGSSRSGEEGGQGEKGSSGEDAGGEGEGRESSSDREERGSGSESESRSEAHDGRRDESPSEQGEGGRSWRGDGRRDDRGETPESETADERGSGGGSERRQWFDPGALTGGSWSSIGTILKWIFYAVLLAAIVYWAWRSRAELLGAFRDFLAGWRAFWERLFGRKAGRDETAADAESPAAAAPRPFSAFRDPFASGMADGWSPDEVVRYTFEALEAWAREHGWARGEDQTPHEFAHELGGHVDAVAQDARRLADLYCRVAYAGHTLPRKSTAPLKQLWQELRHREPVSL